MATQTFPYAQPYLLREVWAVSVVKYSNEFLNSRKRAQTSTRIQLIKYVVFIVLFPLNARYTIIISVMGTV